MSKKEESLENIEEPQSLDESEDENLTENSAAAEQNNELAILKDKLLRQMAETENIRRRSAKSVIEAREYAIFEFSRDLISVMDNFERTLEYLPEDLTDHTAQNLAKTLQTIIEGIKMTKSELETVFNKHQLKTIKAETGDKFDYNLHNAISQITSEEVENEHIIKTMQQGYKIKDRLIRPATVIVAKQSEKEI